MNRYFIDFSQDKSKIKERSRAIFNPLCGWLYSNSRVKGRLTLSVMSLFFLFSCSLSNNHEHSILDGVNIQKQSMHYSIARYEKGGSVYKLGKPYNIGGRYYYPKIEDSYAEEGLASWYGKESYAQNRSKGLTANGHYFDNYHLTAAHRTLPLPSIVRVINLDNNRVLEGVLVNDRGPFRDTQSRIIDLSEPAAKILGYSDTGVAHVRVEYMTKDSQKIQEIYKKAEKQNKTFYLKSLFFSFDREEKAGEDYKTIQAKFTPQSTTAYKSHAPFVLDQTKESEDASVHLQKAIDFTPIPDNASFAEKSLFFNNLNKEIPPTNLTIKPDIAGFITETRGHFYYQVGSFSSKGNAIILQNKIKKRINHPDQVTMTFDSSSKLYKISIGPQKNREDLLKELNKIPKET